MIEIRERERERVEFVEIGEYISVVFDGMFFVDWLLGNNRDMTEKKKKKIFY